MIRIIPKPTDTSGDNSTAMVASSLGSMGVPFEFLDIRSIDPFGCNISNDVIWVCGMGQDPFEFAVLSVLSLENRVVNSPHAIATCASKAETSGLLMKDRVKTPRTMFTHSREAVDTFLREEGQAVIKPLYGFDGNGIRLVTPESNLGEPPYYIQEYIPNDRDFRVFVINGEAVGAIERVSDTLTHNIHQGGAGRAVSIDDEMHEIAEMAAKAIGIDYCGVDLLVDSESYTVLEVNGTPNWHCMEAPIPRLIAEYLVDLDRR